MTLILRQSLVSEWAQCPHRAALVLEHPGMGRGVTAAWNIGGTAFHSAVEWWERERHAGRDVTPAGLAEWASDRLSSDVAAEVERTGTPVEEWRVANRGKETVAWWRDALPPMAADYVLHEQGRRDEVATLGGVLAVELEWTATLAGWPMRGTVDQVRVFPGGDVLILDPKSGRNTPDTPFQLAVYAAGLVAAGLLPNLDRVFGAFYDARNAQQVGGRLLDSQVPAALSLIDRAGTDLSGGPGTSPARLGVPCSWCPVRSVCTPRAARDKERDAALSGTAPRRPAADQTI